MDRMQRCDQQTASQQLLQLGNPATACSLDGSAAAEPAVVAAAAAGRYPADVEGLGQVCKWQEACPAVAAAAGGVAVGAGPASRLGNPAAAASWFHVACASRSAPWPGHHTTTAQAAACNPSLRLQR